MDILITAFQTVEPLSIDEKKFNKRKVWFDAFIPVFSFILSALLGTVFPQVHILFWVFGIVLFFFWIIGEYEKKKGFNKPAPNGKLWIDNFGLRIEGKLKWEITFNEIRSIYLKRDESRSKKARIMLLQIITSDGKVELYITENAINHKYEEYSSFNKVMGEIKKANSLLFQNIKYQYNE
jgi:hypothetical protein